jgi:hypothetical protein
MAIDADVRTLLQGLSALSGVPVEEGIISFGTAYTRVWYGRSGSKLDRFLSKEQGLIETSFDVECISDTLSTCQGLAAAVYTLDGYQGAFGSSSALAIWVDDQADDYVAKNSWSNDAGLYLSTVKLTIVT